MRTVKEQIIDLFKIGVILLPYCVIMYLLHFGCPIKIMTGVSCPGCGMTRAYVSCMQLDFKQAVHFHPLFPLPAMGVLWYIFKFKMPRKVYEAGIVIACVLFIGLYLYRITQPSDFLVARPGDGVIGRGISTAFHIIFHK